MNNPSLTGREKRVSIGLGLMALVLAMLGWKQISSESGGLAADQPVPGAFASASTPTR